MSLSLSEECDKLCRYATLSRFEKDPNRMHCCITLSADAIFMKGMTFLMLDVIVDMMGAIIENKKGLIKRVRKKIVVKWSS